MAQYKITLTRTDNGDVQSQGIDIGNQYYLIEEKGRVSKTVRKAAYTALVEQIRERRKAPDSATLEMITL